MVTDEELSEVIVLLTFHFKKVLLEALAEEGLSEQAKNRIINSMGEKLRMLEEDYDA